MNVLSPTAILIVIGIYFLFLICISYITSRGADNQTFFLANRKSPWLLVAVGMIGASLSGVTFISIPGVVGAGGLNQNFSYMQAVLGYLVGYFVIATVLMPIYYKYQLTTIYGYLNERFGKWSYKTGAAYFILSRIVGASLRLFLMASVLQVFVMDHFGMPFWLTVAITILLIWVYTYQGGIKTIVWTDTLQTICMLTAVALTIIAIKGQLGLSWGGLIGEMKDGGYSRMFYFEGGWIDANNFFKQFLSGALIAIVMTGLDQDMMQKNLTCKSLRDAQKNVGVFSIVLVFANLMFLMLGALLYIYVAKQGIAIPERTDLLYPEVALNHLGPTIGILFVLGLIAAAYSSADSALTSLTTSFCIDFLDFEKEGKYSEERKKSLRLMVHVGFSLVLLSVIVAAEALSADAVINDLFTAAGYTYGPILGLFAFGIMTRRKILDKGAALVCVLAPIIAYTLDRNSQAWFGGLKFGWTILAVNGIITFVGLLINSLIKESSSRFVD